MTDRKSKFKTSHRFLDEAGDTTFYGKGKIPIIGSNEVSLCFILGLIRFTGSLNEIRQRIIRLQKSIENDPYYRNVPSILKRKLNGGFYFHAIDDPAEVRKTFYEFIKNIKCSCEAVVGRKIPKLYERKHNANEGEFYSDLLSHLIKNKFQKDGKVILHIAERGESTRNSILDLARIKAIKRFERTGKDNVVKTEVVFDVRNHQSEPLLNVADYFCWALQRVFERGEVRYYDFVKEQIPIVIDLYDHDNFPNRGNCYDKKRSLTPLNKISPPLH